MRKLILEVQMTLDGFMTGSQGENSWQLWDWGPDWNWDEDLKKYFTDLMDRFDLILLSRKMAQEGFLSHWKAATKDRDDSRYEYANKINNTTKAVFSKTLHRSEWDDIEVYNGNLAVEINRLKQMEGKDMVVYGGIEFVSNLIKEDLIDEFQIFVNPVTIGQGRSMFNSPKNFQLKNCIPFECGITLLIYSPIKNT